MGQVKDLLIEVNETATKIESAMHTLNVALKVLGEKNLSPEVRDAVLRDAKDQADDLFDEAIDFTISVRNRLGDTTERDDEADAEDGKPDAEVTRYGVRIHYPNGEEEDVPNIEAVTVYDEEAEEFPFGFVPVSTGDGDDDIREHRPVWYDKKGAVHPFDNREAPTPYGSW